MTPLRCCYRPTSTVPDEAGAYRFTGPPCGRPATVFLVTACEATTDGLSVGHPRCDAAHCTRGLEAQPLVVEHVDGVCVDGLPDLAEYLLVLEGFSGWVEDNLPVIDFVSGKELRRLERLRGLADRLLPQKAVV